MTSVSHSVNKLAFGVCILSSRRGLLTFIPAVTRQQGGNPPHRTNTSHSHQSRTGETPVASMKSAPFRVQRCADVALPCRRMKQPGWTPGLRRFSFFHRFGFSPAGQKPLQRRVQVKLVLISQFTIILPPLQHGCFISQPGVTVCVLVGSIDERRSFLNVLLERNPYLLLPSLCCTWARANY